jgi:hypothetical protein
VGKTRGRNVVRRREKKEGRPFSSLGYTPALRNKYDSEGILYSQYYDKCYKRIGTPGKIASKAVVGTCHKEASKAVDAAIRKAEAEGLGLISVDREILRLSMIAELDAVNLYEQMAARAQDSKVKKVLLDVAKEEKTHVGEFQAVLSRLDPEYVRELQAGRKEVGLGGFRLPKFSAPVVLGGAVALGVLWMFLGRGTSSGGDVEALSRMILAETGLKSSEPEMAQIVFIAINRARKWGVPVTQVVSPTGYAPGQAWTTGDIYKTIFNKAHTRSDWPAAQAFVRRVLAGEFPNKGFTAFVHPAGMPSPPCASNRVEADTIAGKRCVPKWVAQGTTVGKGLFA